MTVETKDVVIGEDSCNVVTVKVDGGGSLGQPATVQDDTQQRMDLLYDK